MIRAVMNSNCALFFHQRIEAETTISARLLYCNAGLLPIRTIDREAGMAEGVGFEPTVGLTPRSISSRVP